MSTSSEIVGWSWWEKRIFYVCFQHVTVNLADPSLELALHLLAGNMKSYATFLSCED